MICSMTGFGKANASSPKGHVECVIRTVNHRFLEVNVRMPKEYLELEPKIRDAVSGQVTRGRIDCFFNVEAKAGENVKVDVDKVLAGKYAKALRKLKSELSLTGDVTLAQAAALPGVVRVTEVQKSNKEVEAMFLKALDQALRKLVAMRKVEGRTLKKDISDRCKNIRSLLRLVKKEIPKIHKILRTKMDEKIADWGRDKPIDPERATQEISFMLMKMDVSEEVTRLDGHMVHINSVLSKGESIGRKLDFLLQEAHREITTLGNKIQGQEISHLAVEVKAELEKIREQAQNVE